MRVLNSAFYRRQGVRHIVLPLAGLLMTFIDGTALAQQPSFGINLSGGKETVEVGADNLEMRDKENIAIFTGNVSVKQGDRLLRTSKLIVHYAKDSTNTGKPSGGLGSTGIEKMEASGKVYIKTADQIATGDDGIFDSKSNTMVLTGQRVILTDGKNVATGCKLTAHMDTGRALMQSCSNKTGRVSIIMDREN